MEELHSHLMVEIKSSDTSSVESVFPLPLSNFFQVKDLPRGKHLLQLQSNLPSSTHKFRSEIIEVDLEKNSQIHVGPLKYFIEEDHHKQVCLTSLLCEKQNFGSQEDGFIFQAVLLLFRMIYYLPVRQHGKSTISN